MTYVTYSLFNSEIFDGRFAAFRWRLVGRDAYGDPIVASVPIPTPVIIEQESKLKRKDDGNTVIERKVSVLSFEEIALGDIIWFAPIDEYFLQGVWKFPPNTDTLDEIYEVTEIEDEWGPDKGAVREWTAELYEKPFPTKQ